MDYNAIYMQYLRQHLTCTNARVRYIDPETSIRKQRLLTSASIAAKRLGHDLRTESIS